MIWAVLHNDQKYAMSLINASYSDAKKHDDHYFLQRRWGLLFDIDVR